MTRRVGRVRLSELTGRHIADMITAIGAATNRYVRTPSPSTLHPIRATLRSALNAAIREGLLCDNPARHVDTPSPPLRPHALIWTAQRVEAWQQTGERPSVAVWTVEQTATFLSFVAADRLAVMWWMIALRGLRRGHRAAGGPLHDGLSSSQQPPTLPRSLDPAGSEIITMFPEV